MDRDQRHAGVGSGAAFVTGLVAGVMVGAGIGLLCAPRKGSELRGQLSDAAARAGKSAAKAVDDLSERGRQLSDRARDAASRANESVGRVLDAARENAADAVGAASVGVSRAWQAATREQA